MIEKKMKRGPTIKYLCFWKVSSNILDGVSRGRRMLVFTRGPPLTSRNAVTETSEL